MEWSKEKTLKLIELLQVNPTLWNTSLCDTRRDKHKRREELKNIADILNISVADTTKKIQHLRTQYNREFARELRAKVEDPDENYISNWYAFEYLHFLKHSTKPYRILHTDEQMCNEDSSIPQNESLSNDCKIPDSSPQNKIARINPMVSVKPEGNPRNPPSNESRDEFSVFGEYIANELRSLKGEKNLLVAKKKIQDAIFEVKMDMIGDPRVEQNCTVYHTSQPHVSSIHSNKLYSTPVLSTATHIEPLSSAHTTPTSQINEIIINGACHYSNFKVDNQ